MSVRSGRHRPSLIDKHFSVHPDQRDAAMLCVNDLGLTVEDFFEKLTSLGIKTSRSAAARGRQKHQRRVPGPASNLRAAVAAAIIGADDDQLRQIAQILAIDR